MLAEKLNMTAEDAERWIVNLIRNARLDAKIDSQQGHVVMATQTVSPYQQLIEKTKMLSVRSQKLAADIEKKLTVRNADVSISNSVNSIDRILFTKSIYLLFLTGFPVGEQ